MAKNRVNQGTSQLTHSALMSAPHLGDTWLKCQVSGVPRGSFPGEPVMHALAWEPP